LAEEESAAVLVTGSAGFVGSHLLDYILSQPGTFRLHGLTRGNSPNLAHLEHAPRLSLHQLDLSDQASLTALLIDLKPARIFHLAAQSFVGPAITNPAATLNNNLNTTLNLFEAVRAADLVEHCQILNVGSGDVYGFIEPTELPIQENCPFRPGNPYAVSKINQEMLGYQYFRSYGLQIVATRAFNHLGSRQSDQLATSAFARQIALAEAGQISPIIKVGNLEARRDYTDVRDIVRGYWLALTSAAAKPGETYNLCSGNSHRMSEVLQMLVAMTDCSLSVAFDPARARPSDIPIVCGDYSKFYAATGWQPLIPLSQSLRDVLDYWRSQIKETVPQS